MLTAYIAAYRDIIDDTMRVFPWVGLGSIMAVVEITDLDKWVTYSTHFLGLLTAVVALGWYLYRIHEDIKNGQRNNKHDGPEPG